MKTILKVIFEVNIHSPLFYSYIIDLFTLKNFIINPKESKVHLSYHVKIHLSMFLLSQINNFHNGRFYS